MLPKKQKVKFNVPHDEKVRMNYRSGTGERCNILARQTLRLHSPGGSTSA